MPEFLTPVDIGNRALQRVGSELMDPIQGFAENSKRAQEVSFCYGKLRRAELNRSVWTFATRRTALRAVDFNTAILQPTLFDAGVTYFVGSVVADEAGTLWESVARDNTGGDPQNTPDSWKPYFGPMTSDQFQSNASFVTSAAVTVAPSFTNVMPLSRGYHKGELVHTIKGDGTYNVYRSKIDGNVVHPALPNQWVSSTRYKQDDVVNVFPAWSSLTTYSRGQTILGSDGNAYASLINSNLNNNPVSSGASWSLMSTLILQSEFNPANINQQQVVPGTSPINEWDVFTTYSTGNFVIWNANTYLALANGSGNFPSNASFWVQCTGGTIYQSLIDFNLGNNPTAAPPLWNPGTTYASGNQVIASNGTIYTSNVNGNLNINPVTDLGSNWLNTHVPGPWTTVFTLGGGNSLWIQIGGSAFPNGVGIAAEQINYPIGSGPLSETWSRNVYRLPAGFIRRCPQDPKSATVSWLGAPSNSVRRDWTFEGSYIVTTDSAPLVLRFVADVQNVAGNGDDDPGFHDLFCEALACRIALEVCEPLTQSTTKVQMVAQMYKKFLTEAISIDAIDAGPADPPLDDFIAARF